MDGDSKRLYSWWWDSHIAPKHSKWLGENLTDMDSKVKQIILLIEEDADSLAQRAEMFYKKRPVLMKLIEEFYRTYRALAERYDHATAVIRQAHKKMPETFPMPKAFQDDTPARTKTPARSTIDTTQFDELNLFSILELSNDLEAKFLEADDTCKPISSVRELELLSKIADIELDKVAKSEMETLVLQTCVGEASRLSEESITDLEYENCKQKVQVKSLSSLLYQILKSLDLDSGLVGEDNIEDRRVLTDVLCKLEEMQKIDDERQQLVVENSVLVTVLQQLKLEALDLATHYQQMKIHFEQLQSSQIEKRKLTEPLESQGSDGEESLILNKKDMEIYDLKERVSTLEGENNGLKFLLASYISSKATDSMNDQQVGFCTQVSADKNGLIPDGTVKGIEKAVAQTAGDTSKHVNPRQDNQKQTLDVAEEENEVRPKDIMLDHMSECSSYGISKRRAREIDAQLHEMWDSCSRCDVFEMGVERKEKKPPSLFEEDVVDKLEISERFNNQDGVSKRKILERLNSDIQRLTTLQFTVEDLMNKVEKTTEMPNIEYDSFKGQLEETQESIKELFDLNNKLVNKSKDLSYPDFDLGGSRRARKISEHARKGSEKIGRLQLAVQRIQVDLLKVDEKESKSKRFKPLRKTKVLLKDYLYGGVRNAKLKQKTKKLPPFWACLQPTSSYEPNLKL